LWQLRPDKHGDRLAEIQDPLRADRDRRPVAQVGVDVVGLSFRAAGKQRLGVLDHRRVIFVHAWPSVLTLIEIVRVSFRLLGEGEASRASDSKRVFGGEGVRKSAAHSHKAVILRATFKRNYIPVIRVRTCR
jgi:hypothetical protein